MRVLILSQYYHPEPVEKVHDLARGLVERGHQVQVITSFPCYPHGEIYDGYRQRLTQRECVDEVEVVRIPQFPDHSRSAWRRALYYLSFVLSAITIGAVQVRAADVMIVYQSQLPVSYAAWIISRLRRIPVVLDVVDLWPESIIASGMLSSRWIIRSIRRAAAFLYRRVNHINAVTPGFRQNLLALGVPQAKLSVIHNWMPADTYQRAVDPDPELARHEGLAGRFNIMYAGNMGPSQDLQTVVKAAALLVDLPEIQFVFVGDGLDYPRLVQMVEEQGLENVRFLGRRSPEEMPALFALADVLLAHLKPDVLSDVSIPSKIFAYMTSGRPILVAIRGDAEIFVTQNGCGLAVAPSDAEAMARAVRQLFHASLEERQQLGAAALRAYEEKYASSVQIGRFSNLLGQVVNSS